MTERQMTLDDFQSMPVAHFCPRRTAWQETHYLFLEPVVHSNVPTLTND